METLSELMLPGVLFALTLAFGFWLSYAGKPYNGILFNVHKLIALAYVVLAGIQFSQMFPSSDWLLIALLLVSALCVIALFASGALMSAGKLNYTLLLIVHRVALMVLIIVLTLVIYSLLSKAQ